MRKWSLWLVSLLLLVPIGSYTQSSVKSSILTRPADIRDAFRSDKVKVSVGLDSRRSFVSRQDVNMLGARAGLDFDGMVRVGGGIYFLFSDIHQQFVLTNPSTGEDSTVTARLRFNYITFFFEPVILKSRRWEISIPLHLGLGDTYFEGAGFDQSRPRTVVLSEASVIGHYKIFPWIGLGGGVGYRTMLKGNNLLGENFHAPIYMFTLKIFVGWIYLKLFKPEKLEDW